MGHRPGAPPLVGRLMLRSVLLAAVRSPGARRSALALPPSRTLARRFVAGDTIDDAVRVAAQLVALGMLVTVDHLGDDIADRAEAHQTVAVNQRLIDGLAGAGLATRAGVSVKLPALGQSLPDAGESLALQRAFEIVRPATSAGVLVTLDMKDHTTSDSTLRILQHLRAQVPSEGCAVQTALRRTRDGVRSLATSGSRVRVTKGAYREPAELAHERAADVDAAYVSALAILMHSDARPLVAEHDPALVAAASAWHERRSSPPACVIRRADALRHLSRRAASPRGGGFRRPRRRRLGVEWHGCVMRRLAERAANRGLLVRALVSTG